MAFLPLAFTAFSVAQVGRSPQAKLRAFSVHDNLRLLRHKTDAAALVAFKYDVSLCSTLSRSEEISQADNNVGPIDRRPHEQRVSAPRNARRLNHAFQHLYRHFDPRWDDNDWTEEQWIDDPVFVQNSKSIVESIDFNSTTVAQPMDQKVALSAIHYLHRHGGYTLKEIQEMHTAFPPLFEIDVKRHLRPKMRFLKDCMGGGINMTNSENETRILLNPKLKAVLPASFFGARFERTIAPRHAFLVHAGLPHGRMLWDTESQGDKSLFEEFLLMHRKPKQFAAMCNQWRAKFSSQKLGNTLPITSEQIVAFDKLFQRGLLSAARNDTAYIFPDEKDKVHPGGPSLLTTANVTSAQLIRYLIQHGGNPYEEDVRGASLFHWSAGCGNLDALKELVRCCNQLGFDRFTTHESLEAKLERPRDQGTQSALFWKATRDDATPLHWAAAGSGPKEFGIGGHVSVCNYLLALCKNEGSVHISEKQLINAQTKDGNTVLMWAAWSQSLDVVKLLVRNRADTSTGNRNGCSVAHWAASGGSLLVCKYLAEIGNVDFSIENFSGNTPLSHAVAYQRSTVVKYLREELKVEDKDGLAANLALDFVNWADSGLGLIPEEEDFERRKVFDLFSDIGVDIAG